MRIVRVANFVAPHSGGLRTCLRQLGAGYLAAGHEPVLIIPGERASDEQTAQGRVITLRGPRIPFTGGYRVLLRKRKVADLLEVLQPDTLEVSDRTTLRWTGRWAREHGLLAVMISHESLTALLRMALPGLDLPALTRSAPALARRWPARWRACGRRARRCSPCGCPTRPDVRPAARAGPAAGPADAGGQPGPG